MKKRTDKLCAADNLRRFLFDKNLFRKLFFLHFLYTICTRFCLTTAFFNDFLKNFKTYINALAEPFVGYNLHMLIYYLIG